MLAAHDLLAVLVVGVPAAAALLGGLAYWRRRGLGLLLLSDDRRATDELHYAYGSLSLAAILAPWLYAPAEGPRRLLWFAGTSALAAALAVRAFMTGS
jgi:hypothetical protein